MSRSGKLRALAVTTAARSTALPDVPTVGGIRAGLRGERLVYGIGAPKATPPDIVDTLNHAINAGLADAKVQARFADLGGTALPVLAGRVRQAPRRRHREMGQGDPGRAHQGGLSWNVQISR